jgi:large conductance mechanosensitive channel
MTSFGQDFRKFLARGNVVDLAIAFILGLAFAAVVKSLVDDVLMPPLGRLIGNVDFSNLFWVIGNPYNVAVPATLAQAKAAGLVTINYGAFLNTLVQFLIVGLALYGILRLLNRFGLAGAGKKDCPMCATVIPDKAIKCPSCTADLAEHHLLVGLPPEERQAA